MGVDYYNCELCNEIYADCSDYGSCKICNKNVCPVCYHRDFVYYKLDTDVYWSTCPNHDYMYDTDSIEGSSDPGSSDSENSSNCNDKIDTHTQDKKRVLDSVNNYWECKKRGIVIPTFKYLQSLQTGIHCVECENYICGKYECKKPEELDHKEIKCCVCSSKDGSNICKKCVKKDKNTKRSTVLINADLINACEKGKLQDAIDSIENGATNFIEGFNKASIKGHIEIVKLMINEAFKTSTILNYDAAIDFAFENDHIDIIDYLLSVKGVTFDINNYVEFIFRKVQRKSGYSSSNITENYKFDINMYNVLLKHGFTNFDRCLALACLKDSQELADISIAAGATNFNEAMVFACIGDRENMIKLMLNHGANNFNECLLTVCSQKRPIYYDKDGKEPMNAWSYRDKNNINLVNLFLDHGANNLNECLITAARQGFKDSVIILVSKGATHINLAKHNYLMCYNKTTELSKYFKI